MCLETKKSTSDSSHFLLEVTDYFGEKTTQWNYIDNEKKAHSYWQSFNGRIKYPVAFGNEEEVQEWLDIQPGVNHRAFDLPSPKCSTPCKKLLGNAQRIDLETSVLKMTFAERK